jgi:hypothetical protein
MNGTFDNAKIGFELSLGLTGVMTLWLGIMKIGEKGGAINYLSKAISPLFNKLFPGIPKNHPVYGSMVMNIAANMLGLDNAATPLGLKAMTQLQELNTKKDTACFIEEDKDLGALFYKDSTVCYNSINLFAGKIDLDNLIYPYSFEKEVPNSPKPFASMVYRKKYLDTLVIDYILKSGYNGSIITLQNYTKNGYLIGNFSGKFYGYSCFIHPICIHEYIPCDDIFPFDSIEIKKGSFCFKVTRK